MSTRLVAAVTVAAVVAVPAAASGGPGRSKRPAPLSRCQMPDPRGDVRYPAFDITCGYVDFGNKTITGVLALASTQDPGPYEGYAGAEWTLTFGVAGTYYSFRRFRPVGVAVRYQYTFNGGPVHNVKETATEIRWTIPRTSVRRGKLGSLSAEAGGLVSRDRAHSGKRR